MSFGVHSWLDIKTDAARSGCSAMSPRTCALPQLAGIMARMSAFLPITSASPQRADLTQVGP